MTCGCFGKAPAAAKATLATDVVPNNGERSRGCAQHACHLCTAIAYGSLPSIAPARPSSPSPAAPAAPAAGKICIDLDVENGSSHPFKSVEVRLSPAQTSSAAG